MDSMRVSLRSLIVAALVASALSVATPASALDAGSGLSVPDSELGWDRWQGRVTISTELPTWRANLNQGTPNGLQVGGLSVMGDYYFASLPMGAQGAGGFRATSGLLFGAGGSPSGTGGGSTWGIGRRANTALPGETQSELNATAPYVGLGYSGLTGRNGWGFAADVGFVARSAGSSQPFGRAALGAQSLDDLVRDMHLAPIVQLGVSYAF